jgi:sugar phosphate isomerase/epimerase
MSKHRFALDLITLYDPRFWGVTDHDGLVALEPQAVWDRMLDTIQSLEITGVEVTFPPGDLQTAHRAYGSNQGLLDALGERGLRVVSGYFGGFDLLTAPFDSAVCDSLIAAAGEYASDLADAGGEIMIGGMPSLDATVDRGGRFVDLDYIKRLADLVNEVGLAVAGRGLKFGLHPEFGSVFCRRREIDLFMLLTDPEYVGFCPDTAHITLADGDPVAIAEHHRDRVLLTHWKDADGPFEGTLPEGAARHSVIAPKFKQVGEGAVDWHSWQRMLDRVGYGGWAVLELDSGADPVNQVRRARDFVQVALG